MNLSAVAHELETAFGERSERDAALGELTTYRVGGRASIRVRVESISDLEVIGKLIARSGTQFAVVGVVQISSLPMKVSMASSSLSAMVSRQSISRAQLFALVEQLRSRSWPVVLQQRDLLVSSGPLVFPVLSAEQFV